MSREWWISFMGDPIKDKEGANRLVRGESYKPVFTDEEVIHVIEYSAYEELTRQNEIMKEALKIYASAFTNERAYVSGKFAKEALDQIKPQNKVGGE